ncbi:MAG: hypothetical protein H6744_16205 [Deltaproteobacteria bacterium]|nr:hypothetical protein [Deltaproteobacteria bacterium]MCB9788226.1 hypothetical protein [Deltaproteobacteria bacterium]
MSPPLSLLPGLERAWDVELAGLRHGWRRLVKREFADPGEAAALRAEGLYVASAPGAYGHADQSAEVKRGAGSAHTCFYARDAPTLAEALELEARASRAAGAERREAERALGLLLGYPTCCVAAHTLATDQGEDACFGRLLGSGQTPPPPAVNNLFVLSHQLISHFPCRLDCPTSQALGERALETLHASDPTHAAALAELLAAPIVVWDRFRFVIEHPEHGPVIAEQLTHAPRLLAHPPYQAFRASLPQRPPGGTRLAFAPLAHPFG